MDKIPEKRSITTGQPVDKKHAKLESEIKSVLSTKTVDDILVEMKDGSAITVRNTDSLYTALGTMATDKVSSVPVMDNENPKKCLGFVDMLDVVTATINVLENDPVAEALTKPIKKSSKNKKEQDEEDDEDTMLEMIEQLVVQGISAQACADLSTLNSMVSVTPDTSLLVAAQELTKHQRIAVIDAEKNFQGIATQSGFVEHISIEYADTVNWDKKKVSDLKLSHALHQITAETTAYEAFKKMKDEKLYSLAVVSSGRLVDVFTVSDLILWTEWVTQGEVLRFSDFSAMKKPVTDYVEESRTQREIPKRAVVTCKMSSAISEVASDMQFNNIHQVYIVGDADEPLGVITYGDVIASTLQAS